MKFEYPEFFFAFFLLAIPIVIHLFNFRRYKVFYFSSLQFVKQVNEESKSTRKLKHLLVLISRLLAFSALIIAFAQPYKPVSSSSKGGNPLLAIYIDNSFSMSQKGTEGELLSMAKEQARNFISKSSATTRFMLLTNNMEGFEQHVVSKEDALDRLDKIELSPLSKPMDEIINWIKDGVEIETSNTSSLTSNQIVLISDFQKNTIKLNQLLADAESFYYPIQVLPQQIGNLAIDSIWFNDPNFKIGINNELQVRLRNYSDRDWVNLELQLQVNETKRDVFVDLGARQSKIVTINYADLKPGIKKGLVRINDKQMHFDDDYFFSYKVEEKSSVLIIDGESAVPNVAVVYGLDKYYNIQNQSLNQFTGNALNQKDLVVLNGWNEFSSGSVESLLNFMKEGGSVAVFPGENLDLKSYNNFAARVSGPRLMAATGNNTKIQRIAYDDPFFGGMFDKKPEKLNLPSLSKAYGVANRNASGFTQLIEMQNGSPLFVRTSKPYSCYIFTSSLAESFGSFKSNALFSSILLRIAETSQRRYPIAITIGTDAKFPVYKVPETEEPLKLKSEETAVSADRQEFIPETEKENDLVVIGVYKNSFNNGLKAGLFEITKGKPLGFMALNYNRNESDVSTLTKDEIVNGFSEKGIKNVSYATFSDESDASFIEIEKPKEYWRWLLVAALLFFLTEMALLKWMK